MSVHRKISLFFLITAAPILEGCSPNESVIGRVGARLAVPGGRYLHTAVWTGREMIVWGGRRVGIDFNTGGRYRPATDSWTPTSTINAPSPRVTHQAFWTGSEMIVWGGYDDAGGVSLSTGGRYDPGSDSWTPTNSDLAPAPRTYHTAVWTGGE